MEKDHLYHIITSNEASDIIFPVRKKLGPPSHPKPWNIARRKLIGTECKTCGAGAEEKLYLQHTVKNPRMKPYLGAAEKKIGAMEPKEDWRSKLTLKAYHMRDAVIPKVRDCCPVCDSLSILCGKGSTTSLAGGIAGSQSTFTEKMTKELGLTKSSFCNAHGLTDSLYYSTAKDMAKLFLTLERDFKRDFRMLWKPK